MSKTIAIVGGIVALTFIAAGFVGFNASTQQEIPAPVFETYNEWKKVYGKAYGSTTEDSYRLNVFYQNYKTVKAESEEAKTYTVGLNQFADLTDEEFQAKYLGFVDAEALNFSIAKGRARNNKKVLKNLKGSVDWVAKGAVTGVKNQGSCGSCWAFSATGAIEGLHKIKKGTLESYSEQELVDCAGRTYGNNGCNGGLMNNAFRFVKEHGIERERDYPYKARVQSCQMSSAGPNAVAYRIGGYSNVSKSQSAHLQAVNRQPVAVAIDASSLKFYTGGVFNKPGCLQRLNHGVLAVGYGNDSKGGDFFRIKNSWGTGFGEKGYFRLAQTTDSKGMCGMYQSSSYPTA